MTELVKIFMPPTNKLKYLLMQYKYGYSIHTASLLKVKDRFFNLLFCYGFMPKAFAVPFT